MEKDHYHSFSPEETVKLVEVEIGGWFNEDNKAQSVVVQQWLEANRKGLIKDKDAKMLDKKHWLEAIDPHHRYGSNLLLYFKEWEKTNRSRPFFEWLDHGDGRGKSVEKCGRVMLDEQRVSYLQNRVEREGFEAIARNGKIHRKKSGTCLDTKASEQWIYALSPCGELFVGKKEKGTFHHSSFLAGAPVLAAGFIQVSDGTIKGLSWSSGHYKPTKGNFQRLIRFLEDKHVDLSHVTSSQSIKGVNFV